MTDFGSMANLNPMSFTDARVRSAKSTNEPRYDFGRFRLYQSFNHVTVWQRYIKGVLERSEPGRFVSPSTHRIIHPTVIAHPICIPRATSVSRAATCFANPKDGCDNRQLPRVTRRGLVALNRQIRH